MPKPEPAKTAVITRTKNRPLLLERAIRSVLGQTDGDFIHVIVNDGGDPEPLNALVEKYRDAYAGRVTVIHNPRSLGMEAASNVGIRASESTYLTIHDDDDGWHPQFLARMTAKLVELTTATAKAGGIVCFSTEILERIVGNTVEKVKEKPFDFQESDLTLWRMCVGNFFPPIAFLFKREALNQVGLYREDLPVQGDWEFNLRFMQQYEIVPLKEYLALYHVRTQDKTRDAVAYSNSVQGAERHRLYNRYIRNELLRQDLSAGRLGVGFMVNANPVLYRSDKVARRLLTTWETLKAPWNLVLRRK